LPKNKTQTETAHTSATFIWLLLELGVPAGQSKISGPTFY